MELITILNRCHRFRGFVYQHARFGADKKSIEVAVRPRKGSAAVCSRCHLPAPGYDQLAERRFEFIPLWEFLVFLLYTMRRVDCRRCGVVAVEEVPWGEGKRTLTKAYMIFLARWARRLSWKETAEAFRTSWDKVFDAVEHVVTWGLEHRTLGQIDAIGVDENGGTRDDTAIPQHLEKTDAIIDTLLPTTQAVASHSRHRSCGPLIGLVVTVFGVPA